MTAATQSTTTDGADPSAVATPGPAKRARGDVLFFALRSKKFLISVSILTVLALVAIFGPIIDSTDPYAQLGFPFQPAERRSRKPLWNGLLRQRRLRPVRQRTALRRSSSVFLGGGLGALIGMVVGFVGGYIGGWVDEVLAVFTNILLVIPTLAVLLVHRVLPAVGAPRRALRSHLHRTHLVALGRESHSSPDVFVRSRDFVDLAKLSGLEWLSRPRATR